MPIKLYTTLEAAKIVEKSIPTIHYWLKQKRILPFAEASNMVLFDMETLQKTKEEIRIYGRPGLKEEKTEYA